jgi:anti-anti-sigma factor
VNPLARVTVTGDEQVTVVEIAGEIDMSNAEQMRQEISAAMPNTAFALVLDLSAISYLDSAGVRLLFRLAADVGIRQQQLRLALPGDSPLRRVLELGDVPAVAPVHPGAEEAVAAARRAADPPAAAGS